MTIAVFDVQGSRFDISIIGHAGHGIDGQDIVCAACSMLACTLMECMSRADRDGYLVRHDCSMKDGNVRINAITTDYGRKRVDTIVSVIRAGYELLESQYPENVKIA